MPKKPKSDLYESYEPSNLMGVGCYSIWREDVRKKKPDTVIQGFVRKEVNNAKHTKGNKTAMHKTR